MTANSDKQSPATPPRRETFSIQLKCPGCGQLGSATSEENAEIIAQGPQPVLLSVSSGFLQRIHQQHAGETEIVCGVCDSVVSTNSEIDTEPTR
jgi:hypothetical protein